MKLKFLPFIIFFCFLFNIFTTSYAFPIIYSYKKNLKKISNLISNNELDSAKKELEKIISKGSKRTEIFILMGDVYFREENYHKARIYYEKVLRLKNDKYKPIVFNKISDTYTKKYEKIEAISWLKQAILENFYNEQTYLKLADIYKLLDINEKAEDMYKEAYKLNKDNEITNLNLGLYSESVLDYESAINYYENVLKINKNNNIASFKLAKLYFKIGNLRKTLEIMIDLKNSPHKNYEWDVLLGDIYYKKGLYAEAASEYNKALSLFKDDKYIYFSLYLTLLQTKNYEDADKIENFVNKKFNNNSDFYCGINEFKKLNKIN